MRDTTTLERGKAPESEKGWLALDESEFLMEDHGDPSNLYDSVIAIMFYRQFFHRKTVALVEERKAQPQTCRKHTRENSKERKAKALRKCGRRRRTDVFRSPGLGSLALYPYAPAVHTLLMHIFR